MADLEKLLIEIVELKLQQKHFESILESERGKDGTLARESDRLSHLIEQKDEAIRNILYGVNRQNGLVLDVDRLKQESIERRKVKNQIMYIWVALIIFVLERIGELLIKK